MKYFSIALLFLSFSYSAFSQSSDNLVAATRSEKIYAKDLPSETQKVYLGSKQLLFEKRTELLNEQISLTLLESAAKERKLSVEQLYESVIFKDVKPPAEEQIRAIYENNRAQIGNKSLAEVRPQIIAFLNSDPQQIALKEFVDQLKIKYKVVFGKPVSSTIMMATDILVTIGGAPVTYSDYNVRNGVSISDFEGELYDHLLEDVESFVFDKLVLAEAKVLEISAGELLAQEITNKLRDFSEDEREKLENDLKQKLFTKNDVKFFLDEPRPLVQPISIDDDPVFGDSNAEVTVVMFSDFQCPACAGVHPVLKRLISGYGGNVRLIVRDFPLNIHENAFQAAQAANAAKAQGKYFEYLDLLYRNQTKLDSYSLRQYAADLGLNLERFDLDLTDKSNAEEIRKDLADGTSYGITGTPTIFVNGVKVRHLSAARFKKAIDKVLTK